MRLGSLGPCSLVQRRTVVRAHHADSLGSRAIRDGGMLEARERIGEKILAELAGRSPTFDRATRSYQRFVMALRAFDSGDTTAASAALAEACQLMPERSREPWLTGGWLSLVPRASTPQGRTATFAWAAESWPDPESDTALGLRLHASFLALRAGRASLATRLLARAPRKAMVRYLFRLMPGMRAPITAPPCCA
jgi:hypothetical protein